MLKQLSTMLAFLFAILSVQAQGYVIKGKIKGIGDTKVLLGNKPNGYGGGFVFVAYDSVISKNDEFTFTGVAKEPGYYSVEMPAISRSWCPFIIEHREITIEGVRDSIWLSKVSGALQDAAYNRFNSDIWRLRRKRNGMIERRKPLQQAGDSLAANRVTDSIKVLSDTILARTVAFIRTDPGNFGGLQELHSLDLTKAAPVDSMRNWFNMLSPALRNAESAGGLAYNLFDYKETKVSMRMPDFTLPDMSGQAHHLSGFRGKYVLIDFWASWCGPCIDALPEVKKLYSTYKDRGFEVLSVSIDHVRSAWLGAIRQYELPWPQWSDLKGAKGDVKKLLRIDYVPTTYLLDPEGKVLFKDGAWDDMSKLLNEKLPK